MSRDRPELAGQRACYHTKRWRAAQKGAVITMLSLQFIRGEASPALLDGPALRRRALDQLSVALRLRGRTARVADLPEAHRLPTLVTTDTATFTARAHIEVRRDVGNVDWFAWQDGEIIAPADSPARAAELVIAALGEA